MYSADSAQVGQHEEKREDTMESNEAREMLCNVEFTDSEIEQLSRLRRDYIEKERLRTRAELRRLEFVRWLVSTGKLTEEAA
jgi:hypothetical protein